MQNVVEGFNFTSTLTAGAGECTSVMTESEILKLEKKESQ
jgi:hypothetical protein